jgi:hypothetical protein
MQIHINDFTKLLADTQYRAPPGTPKMMDAQVNLAFLRSLGPNYETFQQAMGEQTYRLKPGELYARVRALAESKDESPSINIAASDGSTKALATRISGRRGPTFRGRQTLQTQFKGRFRRPDNGGYRGYGRINKPNGNGNFWRHNSGLTGPSNGNVCRFCKKVGHVLEECRKLKWRNQQNGNSNGNNNGDTEYRPGRPTFRVNVTRFMANTATAATTSYQEQNINRWIVDSASNAHITPFRFIIRNYRPFAKPFSVVGIGGKSVLALGKGSVTLTDKKGSKIHHYRCHVCPRQ